MNVFNLPLIRASQLLPFIATLQTQGLSAEAVLASCCLPRAIDYSNPDVILPTARIWEFVEESARQAGNRDMGWDTAMQYGLYGIGAIGHQLENQHTLRDALRLYAEVAPHHTSATQTGFSDSQDVVFFRRVTPPIKSSNYWQVEQYSVGTMLHIVRSYLGPNWKPRCIKVTATPPDLQLSKMALACDMLIGASNTAGIEVPSQLLNSPPIPLKSALSSRGPEVQPFPDTLPETLIRVIAHYVPEYPVTLETTCRITGLHPKTLGRKLATYGLKFTNIREGVVLKVANQALQDSQVSIAEISRKLGYANHSAFTRAYTRMTGISPQQFRTESFEQAA